MRHQRWSVPVLVALLLSTSACKSSPESEVAVDVETTSPDGGVDSPNLDSTSLDTVAPWVNDARCPADPPWVRNTNPWYCQDAGLECRYPAASCEPGVKPDNVCRCGNSGWQCVPSQFQNCLPAAPVPFGDATRRPEAERRVPEVCPPLEPKDAVCVGEEEAQPPYGCTTGLDCDGEDARCLPSLSFGRTSCTCMTNGCFVDADCEAGESCRCGAVAGSCGGSGQRRPCLHECVPADCKLDFDCPAGQVCSPSYDICRSRVVGYHCRGGPDDCLSSWECYWQDQCRFDRTSGRWGCEQGIDCE